MRATSHPTCASWSWRLRTRPRPCDPVLERSFAVYNSERATWLPGRRIGQSRLAAACSSSAELRLSVPSRTASELRWLWRAMVVYEDFDSRQQRGPAAGRLSVTILVDEPSRGAGRPHLVKVERGCPHRPSPSHMVSGDRSSRSSSTTESTWRLSYARSSIRRCRPRRALTGAARMRSSEGC